MLEKQQDKSMSIDILFEFLVISTSFYTRLYGGEILFEYNLWDQGFKDLFPFQFCVGIFCDYFVFYQRHWNFLQREIPLAGFGDKYLLLA